MLVERSIWTEQQVEAATACITRLKSVPTINDRALAMAAIDAAQCTAPDIALSDLLPAQQPHPEPIAWMVGTAIWWTKEEAERDAAATGLPIVGLGPLTGVASAEQHQGTPVGEIVAFGKGLHEIAWAAGRMPKLGAKLYTHADPGEVERLREGITKHWKVVCDQRAELDTLREQLRLMTGDYRTAIVNGHERITFLGGDCDSVEKMLADNPN